MPNLGIWEILILLVVVLLVFGPKKLPSMGRNLGRGMREFKESVTDHTSELKDALGDTPGEFKDAINPLAPTKKDAPEEVVVTATAVAEPAPAPVAVPAVASEPSPAAAEDGAPPRQSS